MSISVDELLRMIPSKEDFTIRKIRDQFKAKTNIDADKLARLDQDDEDFSSDSEKEGPQEKQREDSEGGKDQLANPIRLFRQKQREFIRPQYKSIEGFRDRNCVKGGGG